MATKVSDLDALTETTIDDKDLLFVSDISANASKKIEFGDVKLAIPWTVIASSSYTSSPSTVTYDGSSFNATAAWTASTAFSLGDYTRPTAANAYVYECVTAGTTNDTEGEPSWGTTRGADTTETDGVAWRCRGSHVIAMGTDMSGVLRPGTPLRYKYGGTSYYGIVWACTASYLAIMGAPLAIGTSLTELAYGQPQRVIVRRFYIDGNYGDDTADLLSADGNTAFDWLNADAYLVHWRCINRQDAGTTAPSISPKIGGNVVATNNANKGTRPGTSWVNCSPVEVNTSNYDIVFDDAVEVACTEAEVAGGTNADDLTIEMVFVLE